MSDWRDGYDDWKLRSPDWDDDPCAEVRAECEAEMRDLHEAISGLRSNLIEALGFIMSPNDAQKPALIAQLRETLGLPDPNAPVEEEIVF